MRFDLLGPLEARRNGRTAELGGPRQRAVFAALLVRANKLASVDYLAEAVWDTPPASPESNLRTYVAGLRRCLREAGDVEDRLLTRAGGYLLRVEPGERDLDLFDRYASAAEAAARLHRYSDALEYYQQASALWRGRAGEGLRVGALLHAELLALEDRRTTLAERQAQVHAELGEHDQAASELRELAARNPLRESLWAQAMRALAHAGRRAEALEAYLQIRRHLVETLGVEPGAVLRELHQRILRGDFPGDAVFTAHTRIFG